MNILISFPYLVLKKKNNSYFYTVTTNYRTGKPYKGHRKFYPELEVTENGLLKFHVISNPTLKYFTEILATLKNKRILQPPYNIYKDAYI